MGLQRQKDRLLDRDVILKQSIELFKSRLVHPLFKNFHFNGNLGCRDKNYQFDRKKTLFHRRAMTGR